VEISAARKGGKLSLSGRALDDAGRPLGGAQVSITLEREAAPGVKVPLSAGSAEGCEATTGAPRPATLVDETGALAAQANDRGRFCVRLVVPTDRYVVHAEAHPSIASSPADLLDRVEGVLTVDLARAPVTLRFDPERPVLWLDDREVKIDVAATNEDDEARAAAPGLPLVLSSETGATLGRAVTDDGGHARFTLDGALLGAPGAGELRVAFAGDAEAGASTRSLRVERRTHVDLAVEEGTKPVPGSPEDGIELRVQAALRCAKHGCPGSPAGAVEARLDGMWRGGGDSYAESLGAAVGAATIERGEARVVVTFPMPAATSVKLHMHYAADAPWFVPGEELELEQPVQPSSPWKRLALGLAALVVGASIVAARFPRRRSGAEADGDAKAEGPGVAVVRAAPSSEGWSGTVVDAHDGFAIGGARVRIERKGMLAVEAVAQAVTDPQGWFALPATVVRPGDELVAEGKMHATIRRPLPKSGVLKVALLHRKRAILNELVDWVSRRGEPFSFKGEPTPGELNAFAAPFREDVATWASAVEQAAYAGSPVDEAAHEAVHRLAPAEAADAHSDAAPGDLQKKRGRGGPRLR
jgi:hypothetical protein